jgi:hypothetical protein
MLTSSLPLFQCKFQGFYGLYSHNHTSPTSLLYSADFLARKMPTLAFNFLLLIQIDNTQFSKVMDTYQVLPSGGEAYSQYLPVLLLFLCVMNALNLFSKAMTKVGLPQFAFEVVRDPRNRVHGRGLVAKARLEAERQVRYSCVSQQKSRSYSLMGDYEQPAEWDSLSSLN